MSQFVNGMNIDHVVKISSNRDGESEKYPTVIHFSCGLVWLLSGTPDSWAEKFERAYQDRRIVERGEREALSRRVALEEQIVSLNHRIAELQRAEQDALSKLSPARRAIEVWKGFRTKDRPYLLKSEIAALDEVFKTQQQGANP